MLKLVSSALLAVLACADKWSHAELHYGETNQIEGVSLNF